MQNQSPLPTIETERLVLRPLELVDAVRVHQLVNDRAITDMMSRMSYPCPLEITQSWIFSQRQNFESGRTLVLGIVLKETREIIGAISLENRDDNNRAELGYWIGKDYWGHGYCTEAARAIVTYGFRQMNLNRILVYCMAENEDSKKVAKKIGMQYEGRLRQHVKKDGMYKDIDVLGVLSFEFLTQHLNRV